MQLLRLGLRPSSRPWGLLPAHAVAVEGRPVSSRAQTFHLLSMQQSSLTARSPRSCPVDLASRLRMYIPLGMWHRRQRRTGGSAPFLARVQTRQGCNADIRASPIIDRRALCSSQLSSFGRTVLPLFSLGGPHFSCAEPFSEPLVCELLFFTTQ